MTTAVEASAPATGPRGRSNGGHALSATFAAEPMVGVALAEVLAEAGPAVSDGFQCALMAGMADSKRPRWARGAQRGLLDGSYINPRIPLLPPTGR